MKTRQSLHTEVVKALVAGSVFLACSCSWDEPSDGSSVGSSKPLRLIEFRPRLDCGVSQPIAYEGYAGEFFGCLGPPCGIAIEDVHIVQGMVGYALEIRLSEAELFKLESYRKALHAGDSFVFLCGTVLTCLNMGEMKISNPLCFELPSIPSSSLDRIKICLSIDGSEKR